MRINVFSIEKPKDGSKPISKRFGYGEKYADSLPKFWEDLPLLLMTLRMYLMSSFHAKWKEFSIKVTIKI